MIQIKCAVGVLDINLGDGSGIELRHRLAEAAMSLPVTYITGNDSDAMRMAAMASGCVVYLTKPFSAQSLTEPKRTAAGLGYPDADLLAQLVGILLESPCRRAFAGCSELIERRRIALMAFPPWRVADLKVLGRSELSLFLKVAKRYYGSFSTVILNIGELIDLGE